LIRNITEDIINFLDSIETNEENDKETNEFHPEKQNTQNISTQDLVHTIIGKFEDDVHRARLLESNALPGKGSSMSRD
jgi:hypothetical protein